MKVKKSVIMIIMSLITIAIFQTKVDAAIRVVVTEGKSNIIKDKTISQYYDMCKELTINGNLLNGTSTTPHMATNEDWAAVAYFANSLYGIKGCTKAGGAALDNTDRSKGVETTINGVTYRSTTGNATGVMDMGENPEYVAGVTKNYANITNTNALSAGASILADVNKSTVTIYNGTTVDNDSVANTGWFVNQSWMPTEIDYPFYYRDSLFGARKK